MAVSIENLPEQKLEFARCKIKNSIHKNSQGQIKKMFVSNYVHKSIERLEIILNSCCRYDVIPFLFYVLITVCNLLISLSFHPFSV